MNEVERSSFRASDDENLVDRFYKLCDIDRKNHSNIRKFINSHAKL